MKLSYRPRATTDLIILHATKTLPGSKRNLLAFLEVEGRRRGLLEVGYHHVILQTGLLLDCRPHAVWGNHARGLNDRSIGVALEGGIGPDPEDSTLLIPEDNFTSAQLDTFRDLVRFHRTIYGSHLEVQPHHHRNCPPLEDRDTWTKL